MSATAEQVFCYVGKCACGCGAIRAAAVDKPEYKDDTAKFVADLVRDGLQVERVTVETARAQFSDCKRQGQLQPHELLGVSENATREEIEYAYRRLAMQAHPDRGGSDEQMSKYNAARDSMLEAARG